MKKHNIDHEIKFAYDPNSDNEKDLWVVIWNWLAVLPKRCILLNYDPMVPYMEKGLKDLIQRSPHSKILKIVDYCNGPNRGPLMDTGIPYEVMFYGYSPYYQYIKERALNTVTLPVTKNIDILIYGNIVGRRLPMLEKLQAFCQSKNYTLCVRHNNLYDQEKQIIIARSKIIISYHSADAKQFRSNDLARSAELLSTGNFLITEYLGDTTVEDKMAVYTPHFNTTEEMLEKVDYYLTHEDERLKLIALADKQFPIDFNLEHAFIKLISI